ncbi:GNAT family N-acetyltransferase [Pseudoalteromonas sp. SSM20]|uniref:GNAT family N-acetyltransferase n=1 Tax=Pseudoalteromonas sp. SSM20 TaxID=3139394 RepID=UPI003BAD0EFD
MLEISTERFVLRPLTVADASERYLSWFEDITTQQFIAQRADSTKQLKNYILEKAQAKNCLFMGIFAEDVHIGNIKYEPIDFVKREATMGILIGDPKWRGRGVAGEVISATAQYLRRKFDINSILLGVECENIAAISAYKKLGFVIYKETDDGLYMRLIVS